EQETTVTGLTPYLSFLGTARQALTFYQEVFGGELVLNTLADFGRARTDRPTPSPTACCRARWSCSPPTLAPTTPPSGSTGCCSRCWAPQNRPLWKPGSTPCAAAARDF